MKTLLTLALYKIKQKWGIHLLMYLISLIITIYPLYLIQKTLSITTGNSAAFEELVSTFSFLHFGDFMRTSGADFLPFLGMSFYLSLVGVIVYLFFTGGIIEELANSNRTFRFNLFFQNSTKYFPKFLGIFLLQIILLFSLFLVSGIFYFIFVLLAEGSTERGYFLWLIIPNFLLFLFICFGVVVSIYAKVFIKQDFNLTYVKAFWKAFYYVSKHLRTIGLFWLLLLIHLVTILIYLSFDHFIGMNSNIGIGIMILIQQLFILLKLSLKNMNYAIALSYTEKIE